VTAARAVTNRNNQVTHVVVTFSGAVNPAEADSRTTYHLAVPGKGGSYTARNAKIIRLKSVRYSAATNTVTLMPRAPFKITKPAEVLVVAMPPSSLQDSQAQRIVKRAALRARLKGSGCRQRRGALRQGGFGRS
jgi:hypothetical protein